MKDTTSFISLAFFCLGCDVVVLVSRESEVSINIV
jgi:hypothetical protein